MDKIKTQAGKVGDIIFDAETGATYKKTVTLTWAILREMGILLWLVVCLLFVGAEWFWQKSIALGQSTRGWYEGLNEPRDEAPKSPTEMGQSALSALGTGTATLLYQAKKQLGIDAQPPAAQPPPSPVKAAPAPEPEPVKPTEAAIAAAAAQAKTETESVKPIESETETGDRDED